MNDFLQNLRNTQSEEQKPQAKNKKNFENSYHHNAGPRFHSQGSFTRNNQQHAKRTPSSRSPRPLPANKQAPQSGIVESALLADAIENLASHVETLVKTQEYAIAIQDRMSSAFDRQNEIFEKMTVLLQEHFFDNDVNISDLKLKPNDSKKSRNTSKENFSPDEDQKPFNEDSSPLDKTKRPVIRKRIQREGDAAQELSDYNNDPKPYNGLMSRKEIMKIIYSMRDQGSTFEQVAKYLTDLRQPTFSGRGEWHAQTVHRLCNK